MVSRAASSNSSYGSASSPDFRTMRGRYRNVRPFFVLINAQNEHPARMRVPSNHRESRGLSASHKSFPCHTYADSASRTVLRDETCRGVHQQSIAIILVRSEEFLRTELVDRHGRSIHSLAGACEPVWASSSIARLSTFNCRLSTSPSAKSFFSHSCVPFCTHKKLNSFVSGNSELFAQNTRGCGDVIVN